MNTKAELRKKYKVMRDEIQPGTAAELSRKICEQLIQSDLFRRADEILMYYPLNNEADIRYAAQIAWEEGKKVAFPVTEGDVMMFCKAESFVGFTEGPFGIMEPPRDNPADWISPLVLVPGLVFTKDGGRIGYGKGFYDRYLASHPDCITAGICYEFQLCSHVPMDEHDRYQKYIVTDKCIYERK